MSTARSGAGVTRGADGRIYVAGGFMTSTAATNGFVSLDPSTSAYTTLAPMTTARGYFGFVSLPDGRLAAIAGEGPTMSNTGMSSVEVYTAATNAWR